MATLELTCSQTVGPFFHPCLLRAGAQRNILVNENTAGERIRLEGRVVDGQGAGVSDAMVELWQANAYGRYHHPRDQRDLPLDPTFSGFGRTGTDADGAFWFETIKPGVVPFDATTMQAPHICVAVFGRGLLNHLFTRIYFADDARNVTDPILELVPHARRATLLAARDAENGRAIYRFDIVLQGQAETVFFNF